MKTIQEKVTAAILKDGWTRTDKPGKFATSSKPGLFLFLGSSGSVRYGRNKATSRPVPESLKQKWIAEGQDILCPPRYNQL